MAAAMRDRQGADRRFPHRRLQRARRIFLRHAARRRWSGARLSQIDSGLFGEDLVATYRKAMEAGFHEDDRRMPSDNRLNIRWGHRRLVRVGNGLAVTLQDISERKAHEAQLERLANEDSLTGLPQPPLAARLHAGRAGAGARPPQTQLAMLFIDLDEFKHVNDSQGHAVGDQLLQAAAQRLRALLRPTDHVVRFGGDEFIVAAAARARATRRSPRSPRASSPRSREPFAIADDVQAVGASVGISVFPRDGADAETLIKHSDIAMYAGKSEGKGQFRFFDPALSATLKSRAQLKHAAARGDRAATSSCCTTSRASIPARGELLSMEALLRWRHPGAGHGRARRVHSAGRIERPDPARSARW